MTSSCSIVSLMFTSTPALYSGDLFVMDDGCILISPGYGLAHRQHASLSQRDEKESSVIYHTQSYECYVIAVNLWADIIRPFVYNCSKVGRNFPRLFAFIHVYIVLRLCTSICKYVGLCVCMYTCIYKYIYYPVFSLKFYFKYYFYLENFSTIIFHRHIRDFL